MFQIGGTGGRGGESYEDVIRRAERLFSKIRYNVAQQGAPTTLKAAFLGPVESSMALDVSLDLFARSDADFMAMFTGTRTWVTGGLWRGQALPGPSTVWYNTHQKARIKESRLSLHPHTWACYPE